MQKNKASGTAIMAAVYRAEHQILDGHPKILSDPIAVKFERERKSVGNLYIRRHAPRLSYEVDSVKTNSMKPRKRAFDNI